MNIAILINTLEKGGAEKQSVYFAKAMKKHFNVYLIVLDGDKIEEKFHKTILELNTIKLYGSPFRKAILLYNIFKKERVDITFSYLARSNLYNAVLGNLASVKYLIGGIRNPILPKSKFFLERFLHNYVFDYSVSNSYAAVESLSQNGFRKNKFHVIHNAIELNENRVIIRQPSSNVNILSVARFVPQKDYITALEAFELLRSKINNKINVTYTIIGYGQLEEVIKNKIRELNLSDSISLLINTKKIYTYFKQSDIFFMSSLFEGFSNSIMEAMSCRLPIVGTNVGDTKFLVQDGVNGYICDFKNPKQMAEKLEILVTDFALRDRMGKESFHILEKSFTLKRFEKKYLNFIESLHD